METEVLTLNNSNSMTSLNTEETMDITLPPSPPTSEEENNNIKKHILVDVGDGQFSYIKDNNSRDMLQNGWKTINITEMWSFLREHNGSFMYSDDNRCRTIYNKMEELGYKGHSGFSFAWTMNSLRFIAKLGDVAFRNSWNNKT